MAAKKFFIRDYIVYRSEGSVAVAEAVRVGGIGGCSLCWKIGIGV